MKQRTNYLITLIAGLLLIMPLSCTSLKLVEEENDFYRVYERKVKPNRWIHFESDFTFTGLTITADSNMLFDASKLAFPGSDTNTVATDPHFEDPNRVKSGLILPYSRANRFYFYTGSLNGKIQFHLFDAGVSSYEPEPGKQFKSTDLACSRPDAIPPQEWRNGLPEPDGPPVETEVRHIILHHTATSNSTEDAYAVIRNIYLDHTQVNGWNDIGYNFLIARDGTLFHGRDSMGVAGAGNIQGAHFCAKNSGTMGVGLLGTFTNELPTDEALQTTYALLAWKLEKESLSPVDTFQHPPGTGDANRLPAIAGHRQGCNTECPGAEWFDAFGHLLNQTVSVFDDCAIISRMQTNEASKVGGIVLYPNPANSYVFVQSEVRDIDRVYFSNSKRGVSIKF